jgi:hypothetical protein
MRAAADERDRRDIPEPSLRVLPARTSEADAEARDVSNGDIQTLLDQAVAQIEATTITYADWKRRVVSGFYAGKHIDPVSGTAWGRGIAYLERARTRSALGRVQ